jgi:hypothetical protein
MVDQIFGKEAPHREGYKEIQVPLEATSDKA